MKKTFFFILFIIIQNYSQTGWYQQTSGVNTNLRGVFFININTGFVTGFNGTCLKTTNEGLNWSSLNIGSSLHFDGIYFCNENTGYIGGGLGTVLKTTNGGVNWVNVTSTISNLPFISSIQFFDVNTGLISGAGVNGKILKTINGGINWYIVHNVSLSSENISFGNSTTGYCASDTLIYKSTNSGENWFRIPLALSNFIHGINFVNSNTGFVIIGGGLIVRTTNGGINWVQQSTGMVYSGLAVYFSDANYGTIVCGEGKIFRTTNSGDNWWFNTTPVTSGLNNVHFINALTGTAVGDNGVILHTTDGGAIGISKINNDIPTGYSLKQNYPNPFNPNSFIRFQITKLSDSKLVVFDILGKEIITLVNEKLDPGLYEAEFNGDNLPSGIYYYKLTITENKNYMLYSETKKMVLVK